MPRLSRIQIAKSDIVQTFQAGPKVLRAADIARVLRENRGAWRLAQGTSLQNFIDFLSEKSELRHIRYPFPQREVIGYTWGKLSTYETLIGLIPKGFYSHYTALRMHGLTEQIPKTIYISKEKSAPLATKNSYDQEAIDKAFKQPQRISSNEIELSEEGVRVVMLQSAHHNSLGIIEGRFYEGSPEGLRVRYTNLERTMIDVVIRPSYAGGVAEVAKAFENAKGKLAVNKVSAMLRQMKFGYPYHQAIGYYLERAGYKDSLVEIFRRQPMIYDFYLAHGLKRTSYCKDWRLYIPEGF